MNYRRIYNDLIMRGWRRTNLDGYCEKHHIIPKCIGGDNCKSNLVKLTAEEHFIAHLLLTRMYPDEYRLASAVFLMSGRCDGQVIKNNKLYGKLRRNSALASSLSNKGRVAHNKGKTPSDVAKSRMSEAGKNRLPISEETRQKLSLCSKGRKYGPRTKPAWNKGVSPSNETKKKISESLKGKSSWNKGIPCSLETKKKISIGNKGKYHTEETKNKISKSLESRLPVSDETKAKLSAAAKLQWQKRKDKKEILQLWCAL